MSNKASHHLSRAKQIVLEISCKYPETLKTHLVKCHLNTCTNTILYLNLVLCKNRPETRKT